MAPTHNDAAAAAAGDPPMHEEPMEVDEDLMGLLKELALRGGLTADEIHEYAPAESQERRSQWETWPTWVR